MKVVLLEETVKAIAGRVIHVFHTEGAGGHALMRSSRWESQYFTCINQPNDALYH